MVNIIKDEVNGDKTKMLIVDDEEAFCFFVSGNLINTEKFEVYVATDGVLREA